MNNTTEQAKACPVYLPNGFTVSLLEWDCWSALTGDLSDAIAAQSPDAYALSATAPAVLAELREYCRDAAIILLWDALAAEIKAQTPGAWSVLNAAVGLLLDAYRRNPINYDSLSPRGKALVDAYRETDK